MGLLPVESVSIDTKPDFHYNAPLGTNVSILGTGELITNHGSQTNPIVSVRGKENGLPNSHQLNQGSFELEPQGILFGLPLRRCSSWTITASYFNDDLSDRRRKKHTKQMPSNQYCASGLPKDIQSSSITTLKQKQFGQNTSKWPFSQVKKHQMSTMFRFHKLSHDMRIIRMTMPNIQLNSKFVNNMSPEWDRFMTAVKLNKGLKETNHEQLTLKDGSEGRYGVSVPVLHKKPRRIQAQYAWTGLVDKEPLCLSGNVS
ncbi:hypothetical protein Tco_0481871 [Tanacetum coccineum]